jgi:hypothetical protein
MESNEIFSFVLTNPQGATIADSTGIATILDNDSTKFYVVNDATENQTFEYAPVGTLVESYNLNSGNSAPRGAASTPAGNKVWVVDANRKVYVYSSSGALLGSWTPGTLPNNAEVQGIATSGTDIWIVDAKSNKVYRYAGAATRLSGSQNAASSFNLNGGNKDATDIVEGGGFLWVTNNTLFTDKVFKYTLSGSLVGSWTISAGGGSPTGITIDPTSVSDVWIVDSATDRIYQYAAAAARTSGSQSAAMSFPLAPGNTNPQGIADPPTGAPGSSLDGAAAKRQAAQAALARSVVRQTMAMPPQRPIPARPATFKLPMAQPTQPPQVIDTAVAELFDADEPLARPSDQNLFPTELVDDFEAAML